VDGISFAADGRWHHALGGLRIDVQDYWGRELLVVLHGGGLSGSC
jgi:hypothetical protein